MLKWRSGNLLSYQEGKQHSEKSQVTVAYWLFISECARLGLAAYPIILLVPVSAASVELASLVAHSWRVLNGSTRSGKFSWT